MSRDLGLEEGPVALSESPHSTEGSEDQQTNGQFIILTDHQVQASRRLDSIGKLHPYTRLLTISDLESCVALENAAFPIEQERASKDKYAGLPPFLDSFLAVLARNSFAREAGALSVTINTWPSCVLHDYELLIMCLRACCIMLLAYVLEEFIYRLNKCPELSLGLFCTATPDSNIPAETLKTGRPVESSRENGAVGVLLAHIVATQTFDSVVTDAAMDYPADWDSAHPIVTSVGHRDGGRTICVHSLGVLPSFQSHGLGRTLMMAYMQQMSGAGIADRIALIAHEHLVGYYEKFGFVNKGKSQAQFGGGGWIDLVFELKSLDARAKYG